MKRGSSLRIVLILLLLAYIPQAGAWGFYAHRTINRYAVFTLPSEMVGFFKNHIEYLSEHATDPDKRSHGVEGEAEKHYIDIDRFGDQAFDVVPRWWKDAVSKYTEDTLREHGILPWWIEKMSWKLTEAFRQKDKNLILYYAANYGHYIADATVPLHTSRFYDGKIPAQKGIHAFWETRIPELFASSWDYLVGRAEYIDKILDHTWKMVEQTHGQVDTVFIIEEYLRLNLSEDKKYVLDNQGSMMKKQFSQEYAEAFHQRSAQMAERNLRRAVKEVGNYWYTCWVNAGQPDLNQLDDRELSKEMKQEAEETDRMWRTGKSVGRPNPEESEQ